MALSKSIERIERGLDAAGLTEKLGRLAPTDLQTLMLEVYRLQAQRKQPASILADYESNRFTRPAAVSPVHLLDWERAAFAAAAPDFTPIALSPVAPLGTCSTVALVDQNKALSTSRNTEVLSDSTNVLALEAASRRKRLLAANARSVERVHLAASHRLLRAQNYGSSKFASHFSLFGLCSAGRSQESGQFELETFALHAGVYVRALRSFLGDALPLRLAVTDFSGKKPDFAARLFAAINATYPGIDCVIDPARESGRDYYLDLCFHVYAATADGGWLELADGGAVNWTQRLLSSAKERCVISGIGSERVCTAFEQEPIR